MKPILPLSFMPSLQRSHMWKRVPFAGLPSNLCHNHSNEISTNPVTAMSTEHIDILDLERTAPGTQEPVYLSIVIEQQEFLFRNLLTCEVVHFHLQLRWQTCHKRLHLANSEINWRRDTRSDGPHCIANAFKKPSGGAWNLGIFQALGILGVDGGIESIGDGVIIVHDVVHIIDREAAKCARIADNRLIQVIAWISTRFVLA